MPDHFFLLYNNNFCSTQALNFAVVYLHLLYSVCLLKAFKKSLRKFRWMWKSGKVCLKINRKPSSVFRSKAKFLFVEVSYNFSSLMFVIDPSNTNRFVCENNVKEITMTSYTEETTYFFHFVSWVFYARTTYGNRRNTYKIQLFIC